MLLERYADYSARARMLTEIHARPAGASVGMAEGSTQPGVAEGVKKPCLDKQPYSSGAHGAEKKRDKKRTLKRL